MKVIKDTFLIRADRDLNRTTKVKGHDGNYLVIDADVNEFEHATQIGTVGHVPEIIDIKYRYDTPIFENDVIIFHYHVTQSKHAIEINGEQFFKCPYFQIWCKIENETIVPLEDFIFVEPIMESEEEMFSGNIQTKLYQEEIKSTGIVYSVSSMATQLGIKEGDKVFVTSSADLEIEILGKKLWRMRIRNVVGIEREGDLICLNNKALVKEIFEESQPQFLTKGDDKKERAGEVVLSNIKDLSVGDKISYHNGVNTSLTYKGELYSYISSVNINYIKE